MDSLSGDESEGGADGDDNSSYDRQLDQFREDWRQELQLSRNLSSSISVTEKAKDLFIRGTHAEARGYLQDAVRFYRQAVQLVPDIELRVSSATDSDGVEEKSSVSKNRSDEETSSDLVDLMARFQKLLLPDGCLCHAEYEQKTAHISLLPMEILLYLFKWVVSSDLDMRSLDQLALVCRGFYLCARDPEIWRLACRRVWGVNTGNPGKYGSWRNMFQRRPRLRYDGAYISKTTYVRHGENSFQDQFYRPWQLVEYFRYMRFFPDGVVLMLTTPDNPHAALAKLAHKCPKHSAVLVGRYYLRSRSDSVLAILKRSSKAESGGNFPRYKKRQCHCANEDTGEQTFQIELGVKDLKQKTNYKLVWIQYKIRTLYKDGSENTSDFDLIQNNFPPFWFSRVKSYTADSVEPLY